ADDNRREECTSGGGPRGNERVQRLQRTFRCPRGRLFGTHRTASARSTRIGLTRLQAGCNGRRDRRQTSLVDVVRGDGQLVGCDPVEPEWQVAPPVHHVDSAAARILRELRHGAIEVNVCDPPGSVRGHPAFLAMRCTRRCERPYAPRMPTTPPTASLMISVAG